MLPAPACVRLGRASVSKLQAEVTIVVPCFNEEAVLPFLVERLERLIVRHQRRWEVVFVDDGSTDRTPELLQDACRQRHWIRVLCHPRNLGLGAALRTGFAGELAPVVCTIDSDCTYPPERLCDLIAGLEEGADLVTASPWHPDNTQFEGSRIRLWMSRALSSSYRRLTGAPIYTFTCLFRAYRRELVRQVAFEEDGFAATAEILVKAFLQGFRVAEQPMPLTERREGRSKMRLAPTVTDHLWLLLAAGRWAQAHRRRNPGPAR